MWILDCRYFKFLHRTMIILPLLPMKHIFITSHHLKRRYSWLVIPMLLSHRNTLCIDKGLPFAVIGHRNTDLNKLFYYYWCRHGLTVYGNYSTKIILFSNPWVVFSLYRQYPKTICNSGMAKGVAIKSHYAHSEYLIFLFWLLATL